MLARLRPGGFGPSSVPLHPVLVAAFPVLFLFAENAEEQVTLAPLWLPLIVCAAGGLVTLLVLAAVLRDWQRGALLASLLLALFFSFGHAWMLVGGGPSARWWLAAGWLGLAIVGGLLIWRGGAWLVPAGRFLNVASIALVAFNVFGVASYASSSAAAAASAGPRDRVPLVAPADPPDVYYIILDRYAGVDTLRDVYGFDNEPFLHELESRGFTVARRAWANYYKTSLSVYSSLSMDEISKESLGETEAPYRITSLYAALRDHLTLPASLKAIGYDYIHLGNWWEPTAQNVDADVTLRFQDSADFGGALFSTTLLSVFSPPAADDGTAGDTETISRVDLARDTTLYTFDRLAESVERPGPNYVFAHLLLPHPPYVFDADGNFLTQEFVASRPETVNYVEQIQFANKKVLAVIDRLLSDPTDPIIVLQSDEGPWPERFGEGWKTFDWLSATDEEISQKFGILNAIHLPEGIDPREYGFTDRTSPFNNFRIVFNAVFGASLPLLPDMTYLSPDFDHMYDFVPYPPRD